jgi:two-component system alkaline phosphatase synthesis response regulator PhoP
MVKIFSVEDNAEIQDLLKYSLENLNFSVVLFSSAEEMFSALKSNDLPDLILLDIMLSGMDGIQTLKILKADTLYNKISVIMLTAKATEINIVKGLDAGADDYVTKPFSVMELSARINANLRKIEKTQKAESGNIVIDTASHEAYANGNLLNLTVKEFELLYMLVKSPNKVQKRDDILNEIWGYEFMGETRTLDMHIRTLRIKLDTEADRIVTIRGIGYKFVP